MSNKRKNKEVYIEPETTQENALMNAEEAELVPIEAELGEEVTLTDETTATPSSILGKVVNCGSLNVRRAPSLKAEIVSIVSKGDMVSILLGESTDEFYRVSLNNGIQGFCMRKYIEKI